MPELLSTAADVLAATAYDPFARSHLRDGGGGVRGWTTARATGWHSLDPEERVVYFSVLGPPADAAALLGAVADALPPAARVTVPRGTPAYLPGGLELRGAADWDFRWTDVPPPPQPGEQFVHWLETPAGSPAEADVRALLAADSPTASAQPGDPVVRRWSGLRGEDGRIEACAADTSDTPRVGRLSSIVTRSDRRGRGLAATVTGWTTSALFAECDLVTLGLYADNEIARRLYTRLGYRDDHPFTSGGLHRR